MSDSTTSLRFCYWRRVIGGSYHRDWHTAYALASWTEITS